MGKIITANLDLIQPIQNHVNSYWLEDLIEAHLKNTKAKIPLVPVRNYRDRLVLLDGHHRVMVAYLFGVNEMNFYLAIGPNDNDIKTLNLDFFLDKSSIDLICQNFNAIPSYYESMVRQGIHNIWDMGIYGLSNGEEKNLQNVQKFLKT